MLLYDMLCYVMSCRVLLCFVMAWYVVLCGSNILCCVMLCYAIQIQLRTSTNTDKNRVATSGLCQTTVNKQEVKSGSCFLKDILQQMGTCLSKGTESARF